MTKILPMSRKLQNTLPHTEWIESQDNFEFDVRTGFCLNGRMLVVSPSTRPNFSSTRNSSIPKGAILSANNLCSQGRRRDLPRLDVGKFMPLSQKSRSHEVQNDVVGETRWRNGLWSKPSSCQAMMLKLPVEETKISISDETPGHL